MDRKTYTVYVERAQPWSFRLEAGSEKEAQDAAMRLMMTTIGNAEREAEGRDTWLYNELDTHDEADALQADECLGPEYPCYDATQVLSYPQQDDGYSTGLDHYMSNVEEEHKAAYDRALAEALAKTKAE